MERKSPYGYDDLIEFQGETLTLRQWAERIGVTPNALCHRLGKLGHSVERALTTPPAKRYYR